MAFLPFLGQAALAFGPSLLNHLFGGDPNQQYRQNVQNLLAPQNMGRLTQQYYQQGLGSPAFSLGQRMVAQGANAAGNAIQARAGMSGVANSGLGALGAGVSSSLAGNQMAQLQQALWNSAQGQAQNNIQGQLGALTGQMPASQTQQLFGAGLGAFGPMLQQFMQQRFGGSLPPNWFLQGQLGGGPGIVNPDRFAQVGGG